MSVPTTVQYKFIERTENVTTITFRNSSPIREVTQINLYKEDVVTGTFIAKQFRYSFDGATWTNFQTLTQMNMNQIQFNSEPEFYLEVVYTRSGINAGNIQDFYLIYEGLEMFPDAPSSDASIDADFLSGQGPSYYLNRNYFFGKYQDFNAENAPGTGLGTLYSYTNTDAEGVELRFRNVDVGPGLILLDQGGTIAITIDSSLDASTNLRNVGSGGGEVFAGLDPGLYWFNFRSLLGTGLVNISTVGDEIIIDVSTEYIDQYQYVQDVSISLNSVNIAYNSLYNSIQDTSILANLNSITAVENINAIQDASIAAIFVDIQGQGGYDAIQDVSILANLNSIISLNADIVRTDAYQAIQDASIFAIQPENIAAYQAIQDGSIAFNRAANNVQDGSISTLTTSVDNINIYQAIQDASILASFSEDLSTDASVERIDNYNAIQDVSILLNTNNVAQLDASMIRTDAYQAIQDVSIIANVGNISTLQGDVIRIDNYDSIQDVSILENQIQIAQLDSSIIRLDNYQAIQDASILASFSEDLSTDASVERIDNYNAIQDASILENEVQITQLDASIVRTDNYQAIQDASILENEIQVAQLDSSIVRIDTYQTIQDVSIAALESTNIAIYQAAQDASILANEIQIAQLDSSIGRIDNYNAVQDASILTNLNNIIGLDASIVRTDAYQAIQDASILENEIQISQLDSSIIRIDGYNVIQDVSILGNEASITSIEAYQAIQDASILASFSEDLSTDASIERIDNYNSIQDASILYNINNNIVQDVSISTLTADIVRTDAYQVIQDVSILENETQIAQLDSSIIRIDSYNTIQDTSISTLEADIVRTDAYQAIQDTSISNLEADIVRIDGYDAIQDASILQNETDISSINLTNYIQDVSIASLTADGLTYVKKTGDTMTGHLYITNGGFNVGSIGSPQDSSFYSDVYVHNDLTVAGDLIIDGSLRVLGVETIDVSTSFIHLNTGLTGTPPSSMQSGVVIGRGNEEPYVFIFDESTKQFRIGIAAETSTGYLDASTQAVATREDTPIDQGVAYWNNTLARFNTDASMTYSNGVLDIDNVNINQGSLNIFNITGDAGETTALFLKPSGLVVTRELQSGAFGNLDDYVTVFYTDGMDASILLNYNVSQDVSAFVYDMSINKLDGVASTTGVASGHEVYSSEINKVAYIKQLVAGAGTSIISDASSITITATGSSTIVSKFSTTLNGTIGNSKIISQATHGLPVTQGMHVTVYDNKERVFPGISYNSGGDVAITWIPGSLSADCSVFITA